MSLICCMLSFVAHADNAVRGEIVLIGHNGNLVADRGNVVVFIDGLVDEVPPTSRDVPKITHMGREFAPRVLPLEVGGTVEFFNDDNIYHNVFSLSRAKPFDLGIYPEGTSKIVRFENTGLVKLYCNIHPNMVANILVLNNRLYDVTEPDGVFRIEDVPSGDVTLRIWHEFAENQSYDLSLDGGETEILSIEVHETLRQKKHPNKFGKPYKRKY